MAFWKWYDRGARVDFAGTLLGFIFDWKGWISGISGGLGGGMTYLWAAIANRDPLDVTVLALVVAACLILIVYFGISLLEKFKRPERPTNEGVPEQKTEFESKEILDDLIPLHLAASEAYGATRGTIVSGMAESGDDPKYGINVLTWYATYMAVTFKAPIYGQMHLSPKRELIDMRGFAFSMDGETIVAKEIYGNRIWEKITIKRSDLDRAIKKLQETAREVP